MVVVSASAKVSRESKGDSYMGLLYPTEDYKVYGYLTSTRVKLILVTHTFNAKEGSVRKVMARFRVSCFYGKNGMISS